MWCKFSFIQTNNVFLEKAKQQDPIQKFLSIMISWEILKIPVKRICIMSRCRRKRINRFFYIRKDTQSEIFSIRIRKKSCNYAITFWKIMFVAFERKLFSNIKAKSFSAGVFIMSSKKYTFNRLIWLQTRIFIKKTLRNNQMKSFSVTIYSK